MDTYGCESFHEEAANFRMLSGGCAVDQMVDQQETFQYQQLCSYNPTGNNSDDGLYKPHPNDFNNNNNHLNHNQTDYHTNQHQHHQHHLQQQQLTGAIHQQYNNQQAFSSTTGSPQHQHQQSVQQMSTGNMHFLQQDNNNYCFPEEQQQQQHATSGYLHSSSVTASDQQQQYEQHYNNERNYDAPLIQVSSNRCVPDNEWQSPTSSSSYYESSGSCQAHQPHHQQLQQMQTDLQATSDTTYLHSSSSSSYNNQQLDSNHQDGQTFYQHEQHFNQHQHQQVSLHSSQPCYASLDRLNQSCDSYGSSSQVVSTTNEFTTNTTSPTTTANGILANSTCGPLTIHHQKPHPLKSRRGRPRKKSIRSKTDKVNGKLWEFIRDLLLSDRTNPSFIRWERREDGVFKFVQSDKVAKMWGERKQNPKMTYEKLSRAMRYYYKSKVLLPVFGRRLVYKFGPNATGWMPEVAEDIY